MSVELARQRVWEEVWDERVLVCFDAGVQTAENRREHGGEDGRHDEREAKPDDEGVTLPHPELARESDWVGAGRVEQVCGRKRKRCRAEDAGAKPKKRNEQHDLQRVDEMVGELRGREV